MNGVNSAFISYRRDPGYASAKLIWEGLRDAGIDAFLDLESMNEAGDFNARILNQIAGRPYFVIVLTEGTLDRCANPGDWLWRELEYALGQGRIIVPALIPPFDIADADRFLPSPDAADALEKSNGVTFPPDYFDAAEQRLIRRLQPVELDVRELSSDDHDFARRASAEVQLSGTDDPQPSRWRWGVTIAIAACLAVLVAAAVVLIARARDDSTSSVGSQLDAGEALEPGQRMTSAGGGHVLELTDDGRLVASTGGREWWHPNAGRPGVIARMQLDGNFVVYEAAPYVTENAVWATRTQGNRDAVLVLEDDGGRGTVTVYAQDGRALFRVADQATDAQAVTAGGD